MPGPYQGKFVEATKKIEELNQQFRPSKSEASMYWDENVKKALVENGIKLSTFGPCMVYSQGMVGLCYAEDADAYMVQIKQALKMVEMKDSSKKAVMLISTSTSGKSFNASGSMPLWLECYGTYLRTQDKMSSSQFISVHNASTNPSTGMKRWPRAPTAISLEPKAFEPDKDTRVDWQLALAKGLPGETFQYIQKILRGWQKVMEVVPVIWLEVYGCSKERESENMDRQGVLEFYRIRDCTPGELMMRRSSAYAVFGCNLSQRVNWPMCCYQRFVVLYHHSPVTCAEYQHSPVTCCFVIKDLLFCIITVESLVDLYHHSPVTRRLMSTESWNELFDINAVFGMFGSIKLQSRTAK